jgi:hypothetical protein
VNIWREQGISMAKEAMFPGKGFDVAAEPLTRPNNASAAYVVAILQRKKKKTVRTIKFLAQ